MTKTLYVSCVLLLVALAPALSGCGVKPKAVKAPETATVAIPQAYPHAGDTQK